MLGQSNEVVSVAENLSEVFTNKGRMPESAERNVDHQEVTIQCVCFQKRKLSDQ